MPESIVGLSLTVHMIFAMLCSPFCTIHKSSAKPKTTMIHFPRCNWVKLISLFMKKETRTASNELKPSYSVKSYTTAFWLLLSGEPNLHFSLCPHRSCGGPKQAHCPEILYLSLFPSTADTLGGKCEIIIRNCSPSIHIYHYSQAQAM